MPPALGLDIFINLKFDKTQAHNKSSTQTFQQFLYKSPRVNIDKKAEKIKMLNDIIKNSTEIFLWS